MRPTFLEMMVELNVWRLGCAMKGLKAKDFLQGDLSNMVPTGEVEEVSLQSLLDKDTNSTFQISS